jgi:hypothetical protein
MKTIRNITSVGLLLTALSTTLPARADVIAWGLNNAGQCDIPTPPAGAEWVAIAAGDESTLLLASDGSIAGVGWCGAGQCSAPALPPGKRYVAIAAGSACGAALRNDGELFVFGSNEWGQHEVPQLEPGLTYVELAVGWDHIAARRNDGTVVVWGRGTYGEHNVPALPSGVTYTQISSGVYFSAALRSDGQISVWGYIPGFAPALPLGCTYVEVKAGYNFVLARRSDGEVVSWGSNSHQQCDVPALPQGLKYVEIEAGRTSSMARRSDGSVIAWGDNAYGQSEVPGWTPATTCAEIALGWVHSVVRLSGSGPTISSCRTLHVYDPTTGAYDPSLLNMSVTVEGVVYVAPGTYSGGGGGFLQDETGGINFWREQMPTDIHVGDRIRVTGPIWPDLGMLYVGTYTYTKIDSLLAPMPTEYVLASLLADYSNAGSHVSVTGRVADLTPDSFWLEDGPNRIEVRRSDYAGVDFGALEEGMTCTVVSPCLKRDGTMILLPKNQAGIVVPDAHYVAVGGDDADLGTPERPYRTIQRGILAAKDGDVVLIADGLYTGDGNRDIDFMGKIIRVRSLSGQREACVIDAQGSVAEPRVGFKFTGGETRESVLEGVTVIGGYPAGITCAAIDLLEPVCSPTIRSVVLEDNSGSGLLAIGGATGGSFAHAIWPRIVSAVIRNNVGNGFRMGNTGTQILLDRFRGAEIDSCVVSGNGGHGVEVVQCRGLTLISETDILENAGHGVLSNGDGLDHNVRVQHCRVVSNGAWGIESNGEDGGLWVDSVVIEYNTLGGVNYWASADFLDVVDSDVRYNQGPGIKADCYIEWRVANSRIVGNSGDGVSARYPGWGDQVIGCVISENGGTGIHYGGSGGAGLYKVSYTLLVHNGNGGIQFDEFSATHREGGFRLHSLTIADNIGFGVNYASGDVDLICQMANTVIANNSGPALIATQTDALAVTCSNFHGNEGGDWSGPLAGYLGTGGNLSTDPMFCDAAGGDYHLRQNSPLSADNSGACGTIGALEWNCAALSAWPCEPQLSDVPGDQGGSLRISWAAHPADALAAPDPITTYEVQNFASTWQTIATMAAAAADTYATDVVTPAVLTVGQPAPYARYRLIARTADPMVFFDSLVDSAYSIDNMAPPKPAALIVEDLNYRYIMWTSPGIADLATACVYRGTESAFTPDVPVGCPADFFDERDLGWYFYRVQFSDIHGNLSEFSDELHGQWPTPVPHAVPQVLKLYPCQPNPFNPHTTIKYYLPEAGSVRLLVFDVSGRLVRTLVDDSMPQGSHEVAWDGRDASGREVGSGSYLARLEFGGELEVVRMGLIR